MAIPSRRWPKSIVRIGVLCLVALASMNACGPPPDRYYFILNPSFNPYWQLIKEGIEAAGTKAGISPTVVFADTAKKDNSNWYGQIVSQKPKIIVLGGLTPAEEVEYARAAQQQGIKVADVNFESAQSNELKKANIDLAFCLL